MAQIAILNPESAKRRRLTIDVVVYSLSGSYHLSRLMYSNRGLYDVARTYESPGSPIDIHTSYHPSGVMHCKLTRGKLLVYPAGQVVGKAQPHTNAKEIILWQRKGQPWQSLRGAEKLGQCVKGVHGFTDIRALAAGYPIYCRTGADYVVEIAAASLLSGMGALEFFLVEPGNVAALEAVIKETTDSFDIPHESLTCKRAELFTNLSPWLAIVLFAKEADN